MPALPWRLARYSTPAALEESHAGVLAPERKDTLSLQCELSAGQCAARRRKTPQGADASRARRCLSDVVREAIDERFAELRQRESQPDVRTMIRRIFEQYPDPPDLPLRDYDVHDRRAARVAILRKIRPVRP